MAPGAAIVETHISVVVFVGDHAYKLKRPIRLPFVDLTELEERERLCRREVELNRRLAPDVYLGVGEVRDPDGSVCDHLVVMRRLPAARRLSRLVAEGDPTAVAAVDDLASILADFHSEAPRSATIDAAATPERIEQRWSDLDAEVAPGVGPVLSSELLAEIRRLRADRFSAQRELFAQRIAAGSICDGHGDLQADDVYCMDDGPRVLDCVEFDDELRHVDVVDDLAFLVMDLRRLGDAALAERLVRSYDEASHTSSPRMLIELYAAYRAMVRCMVAVTRWSQHDDPGTPDALAAAASARHLGELCRDQLRAARPVIVLVGGLPGTGKSTLAQGLAARTGATLLRSDVVRKELAGLDPDRSAPSEYGHGIYTTAHTEAAYAELAERSADLLRLGRSVIVDASLGEDRHRQHLRDVASSARALVVELRCEVSADTAARRITARAAAGVDPSDATVAVASQMAGAFDAWPEAATVATDVDPATVVGTAARIVGGLRGERPG